ncbi:hypothetical protein L4D13_15035 [Photobacterium profundum]|uniref:hypothetical protein n=1 Tax=Photobacterium profundum TaxID=74109 RepID=UPI003D13A703
MNILKNMPAGSARNKIEYLAKMIEDSANEDGAIVIPFNLDAFDASVSQFTQMPIYTRHPLYTDSNGQLSLESLEVGREYHALIFFDVSFSVNEFPILDNDWLQLSFLGNGGRSNMTTPINKVDGGYSKDIQVPHQSGFITFKPENGVEGANNFQSKLEITFSTETPFTSTINGNGVLIILGSEEVEELPDVPPPVLE